jgi:hypothetical protein
LLTPATTTATVPTASTAQSNGGHALSSLGGTVNAKV